MAQEDYNPSAPSNDRMESSSSSSMVRLERKEDGNLVGAQIAYIRSCMQDMLSQIWSVDYTEKQREGHQHANSPASEPLDEYENELTNGHVNFVDKEK